MKFYSTLGQRYINTFTIYLTINSVIKSFKTKVKTGKIFWEWKSAVLIFSILLITSDAYIQTLPKLIYLLLKYRITYLTHTPGEIHIFKGIKTAAQADHILSSKVCISLIKSSSSSHEWCMLNHWIKLVKGSKEVCNSSYIPD